MLSTTKVARSNLTPVSQLPPEIICIIFLLVQRKSSGLRSLVHVTHVCRQWRNIALDTPFLWTNIPLHHRRWMDEMLIRSKTSGLVVNSTSSTGRGLIHVLNHAAARIKDLSISASFEDWECSISNYLPSTVPRLETLKINLDPYSEFDTDTNFDWEDIENVRRVFIQDAFFNSAEMLRSFELRGANIDWKSPLFGLSLTSLCLDRIGVNARPTITQLVNILSCLAPTLESLTLAHALPRSITGGSNVRRRRAQLINLHYLMIYSEDNEAEGFFQFVTFPHTTTALIYQCFLLPPPSSESSTHSPCSRFLSALAPSYRSAKFQTFSASSDRPPFECDASGLFVLFSPEVRTKPSDKPDRRTFSSKSSLMFRLYWTNDQDNDSMSYTAKTISDFFNSPLPLHDIVSADLSTLDIAINSTILAHTFGTLPKLNHLIMGPDNGEPILQAMQLAPNIHPTHSQLTDAQNTSRLFFSGLLSICLYRGAYEYCDEESYPKSKRKEVTVESLRNCIVYRRENKTLKLSKISILECTYVTASEVETLKSIVEDVEWDQETLAGSQI